MISIDTDALDPMAIFTHWTKRMLPVEAVKQKFPQSPEPSMPIVTDPDPSGSIAPTLAFLCGITPSGASLGVDAMRQQARILGIKSQKFGSQWETFAKEYLASRASAATP